MNAMQAQGSNQLLSQTIVNPKMPNVSEISLRSIKSVEPVEPTPEKSNKLVELTPNPDSKVIVDTKNMDEEDKDKEILDIFSKVAVNIPLLDVIKKIRKYAKFLKDLCTQTRRLKGNERVNMGRNVVLALIYPKLALTSAFTERNVSVLTQAMP